MRWRGKIPLIDVEWNFSPEKECILSDELESYKNQIWDETLVEFPETYDGEVLVLDKFQFNEKGVKFALSFIRFSRILTLVKKQMKGPGLGTLGFQAIIFTEDKKHILAGTRSEKSQYCPLFHSVPGGMLEVNDTKGHFENACMREIKEEVKIELASEKSLVGIIPELHGTIGVVTIISATAIGKYDLKKRVSGNDEWKDQELSWYDVDRLDQYIPENSLEGLLFVKNERNRFLNEGSSVLWP